jgi:hypothetical protein
MKQSLSAEVTEIMSKVPIVKNLARKKFIGKFVVGLIKSRNVQFCQVAQHLNDEVQIVSNEVRIQDFFREVDLNYHYIALLLLSLLPKKKKLRLCIDRTEWDFGAHQVNILMVVVSSGEITVPLYWEMLDNNSGNSSCQQRNDLVGLCIDLIGAERIGLVIGDREFVGHHWLKYLKDKGIRFVMRFPKHHNIHRPDGRIQTVGQLDLIVGRPLVLPDCLVDGVVGNVWVILLADGDYLFLLGTVKAKFMGQLYRKRWCIEACFQNMKGRGFDLECTHLQDNNKLKKLVALVSIAYAFCTSLGIYYHQRVKPIRKKNHAYKANSFARKGIDLIQEWFRTENYMPEKVYHRFICFIRHLKMTVLDYL